MGYPRKSEDMSKDEYQTIVKKYWDTHRKKANKEKDYEKKELKRKAERESRTAKILETMIPEDLEGHPDFPEYVEGITNDQYADKVENYWTNRRRMQLKRKSLGLPDPSLTKKRRMEDFSE